MLNNNLFLRCKIYKMCLIKQSLLGHFIWDLSPQRITKFPNLNFAPVNSPPLKLNRRWSSSHESPFPQRSSKVQRQHLPALVYGRLRTIQNRAPNWEGPAGAHCSQMGRELLTRVVSVRTPTLKYILEKQGGPFHSRVRRIYIQQVIIMCHSHRAKWLMQTLRLE